jgi:hypothetical protein
MDERHKTFVQFLVMTGTRFGEATAIRSTDIDLTSCVPTARIKRAWKCDGQLRDTGPPISILRRQPSVGKQLTPLSDWFIGLVKMIVIPVVFCVVSLGIASMDSLRKAGRICVKALGYFIVLSLVSMLIGLVVANVFHPGTGMNIDPSKLDASKVPAAPNKSFDGLEFVSNIIPESLLGALTGHTIIAALMVSIVFGAALNLSGESGAFLTKGIRALSTVQDRQLGHAPCPGRHVRRTRSRGGQLRHPELAATRLPDPAVHRNLHRVRSRDPGHDRPCLRTEHLHGDALPQGRTADRPEHLLQRSGPAAAALISKLHSGHPVPATRLAALAAPTH